MSNTAETIPVSFGVQGEFLTDFFRAQVREGNWRKALEGLLESIEDLSVEQAHGILSGRYALVGHNSLDLVEDDAHLDPEWVKEHYYTYTHGVMCVDGEYYRKYGEVEMLVYDDAIKAMEQNSLSRIPRGDKSVSMEFSRLRAKTYCQRHDDIPVVVDGVWCLFRPVQNDRPVWIFEKEFKEMLEEHSGHIKKAYDDFKDATAGVDMDDEVARQDEERASEILQMKMLQETVEVQSMSQEDLLVLKDKIRQQADENGGWRDVCHKAHGKTYRIPERPFVKWALSQSPLADSIEWEAVCPAGMKMGGDDPNHSDWYLFVDETLETAYDQAYQDFWSKFRSDIHHEYTDSKMVPLIRGDLTGFNTMLGKFPIVHAQPDTQIEQEHSIVVIPTASPDYEMVAHQCAKKKCLLITEVGGKLCHLAIVGREFGLSLYMLEDALERLPNGRTARVYVERDDPTIVLNDFEAEEALRRKGVI